MGLLERRRPSAVVPPRSRSLTAAGVRVERAESGSLRRLIQPWQHRALAFYETLGEVNFAGQFYARTLSKIRYFAAELDDNGDPQESENPGLIELWDRVQDPGGGRTNLFTAYGQLMFVCGDCYLVCSADPDYDEKWEILSVAELRATDNGRFQRVVAPGLGFEELISAPDDAFEPMEGEVVVYRLFRPDPRFRKLADGPMRGVLNLCEELTLLDLEVRARAKSRIANAGVLFINDSISPPDPTRSDDDDAMSDPFFRDLFNGMMAPIGDPGSAAAVVPLVVRVNGDLIEKKAVAEFIKFSDPSKDNQHAQDREATIKRLAIGMDFPIEYLLGMTDANHWSSWMVDEQSWKAHLMPVTQRLCDDFGSAYLRPAAKDANISGIDWKKVVVGYDAAEVINHPDKAKDAQGAYDRRVVSKEYYRNAIGATDDDAMPQEEIFEQLGVAIRDGSLAVYGIPGIKAGGVETKPGEIVDATGEHIAPTDVGAGKGAEADKGPPAEPSDVRTAAALPFEVGRIVGAAESHLERARELAGNRLRNRSKGCQPCQDAIQDQPAAMVASLLGVEQAHAVLAGGATERDLVAGTAEAFARAASRFGVPDEWALELGGLVETHAARTLYEPEAPPLPANFAALTVRALQAPEPVAA